MHNILGSAEDAKDVIHDTLVKFLTKKREDTADVKNYLIKSVINTAINFKSKRKVMLRAGEMWLPEPIATNDNPETNLYLNDILSYSLLVMMERLSAKERAVFILKETFDYTHKEIAGMLNLTEDNSRTLLHRAKLAMFKVPQKRTPEQVAHEREVLVRLMSAIRRGDVQELENTMAADIMFYGDGGGKVPLLAFQSKGAANVAALLMTAYNKFLHSARIEYVFINHQPALISFIDGRINSCQVFDLHPATGSVLQMNVILDPHKLKMLNNYFQYTLYIHQHKI